MDPARARQLGAYATKGCCFLFFYLILLLGLLAASVVLEELIFNAPGWIPDYPVLHFEDRQESRATLVWKNFPTKNKIVQVWQSGSPNDDVLPRWTATRAIFHTNGTQDGNVTFILADAPRNLVACVSTISAVEPGTHRPNIYLPCYVWKYRVARANTRTTVVFDEGGWVFLFIILFLVSGVLIVLFFLSLIEYLGNLKKHYSKWRSQVLPRSTGGVSFNLDRAQWVAQVPVQPNAKQIWQTQNFYN